ncbi:unnamed protein product [Vicia faba]|uniref:Uncharacterized protein n=1 Tax=Vicia faba TaxID=3906 RepID=A0AAV0YX83_VICFA|nr:unnamed protein product [Vicia faba]
MFHFPFPFSQTPSIRMVVATNMLVAMSNLSVAELNKRKWRMEFHRSIYLSKSDFVSPLPLLFLFDNNSFFSHFNAESTEPYTLISFSNFRDVCWCASSVNPVDLARNNQMLLKVVNPEQVSVWIIGKRFAL